MRLYSKMREFMLFGFHWCEKLFCVSTAVAVIICTIGLCKCSKAPNFCWTKAFGGADRDKAFCVKEISNGGYIVVGYTASFGAGAYDVYLVKVNESGEIVWERTFGGSSWDFGYSVIECADGGFLIVGSTESFGAGNRDVYIIKTNANGDTVWTRTYGGIKGEEAKSVVHSNDGCYIITGYTSSVGLGCDDVYLLKVNANGDTLWTKTYGWTEQDVGCSVQQTSDGGYIIAGYTNSFGGGYYFDACLFKTDADGNLLWHKIYEGTGDNFTVSVQETSDNGYIMAGYTAPFGTLNWEAYLIKTDVNGDTLWTKTFRSLAVYGRCMGESVDQTPDGGYIIAGLILLTGANNDDVYLIKVDSNGNTVWTRCYGGKSQDYAESVQHTSDGGYIVAGSTCSFGQGGYDYYLIKTDSIGDTIEVNLKN